MARLSPETLVYGLQTAGDPQLSPDGSHLLYTLARADKPADRGSSQVWLAHRDGSDACQITAVGDRNREARWSPDGCSIAFVSDRQQGHSAICVLPADGPGEARQITSHRGAISAIAWSPDSKSIAYTANFDPSNPDEESREGRTARVRVTRRLDYKQDNRGFLDDVRSQVFVVDVASGTRRRLTSEPHDLLYPQWSPDGQRLAAREPHLSFFARLALIDVASGDIKRIGWDRGVVGVWSWSPSGDRIVFAGDEEPTGGADLFVYDVAADAIERVTTDMPCLPDAGFPTVVPPSQPIWLGDDEILFSAIRAGEAGLYRFDLRTKTLTREHAGQSLSAGLSADASRRYVAQSASSLEGTGEISLLDRQSGTQQQITHCNGEVFAAAPCATWERFDVERNGVTVEAWLLKPPDFDPTKKYPVVLDIHGGPNGFYGYGFNAFQQLLASNGFVVVFSNPRGSGTYGGEFARMVWTDWGGEDYFDLMAVLDTVLERPYVDPERTGIWGYSYGGYMTAWTIGHTDRFKAAVCGAPCFDLESMFGTSDVGHSWGATQWGGKPFESAEAYAAHSPSTFAHRARTPTLIMQGEADDRCPIGQGEQMFVALSHAGCEVEFVRYPGGAHAMLRVGPPSHRVDFLQRVLDWFVDHLGAAA